MFKEQFSKMSAFRKRAFAVALSAAVVSTSFNIGTYAVEGGSSANGRVITAFEELPEDILYQYLPVGANESDINFPDELNVTLYSDTEEKKEEQSDDSGDIVIEEPEQENPSEEPTNQDDGTTGSGAGESGSDETVDTGAENTDNGNTEAGAGNTDTGAGNTDTGADTGSTETGTTEPGAGAGETIPEESPETSGETGGEGAGEGNTESGTSEEAANDEGSQESSQEEGGSSEPSDETAVDESAIQGIRSTAAAVIRAFKPVTVYAAENEDGGEQSEGGDSESAGEEGGEGENKENESDTQNEGGAEITDNNGNNEQNEGVNENSEQPAEEPGSPENTGDNTETVDNGNTDNNGEAAAPEEESGSSEDGNSDAGNSDAENTDNNTDEGITELSDGEARVLRDVNWKLVRDESTYSKFQAVLEGDVFVYEPKISEYGLKSDVELPKIRVTIVAAEETVSEDTVSEDTVSEDAVSGNSPAFSQMMIVGGVRVTVEAPEGVFPEGAVLHVKKLEGETLEKAESYVKEDMGVASETSEDEDGEEESEEGNSSNLEMVAFDVTITDAEGNEIQPNTEFGEATVKFANVDLVGNYLDAQEGEESEDSGKNAELKVYHFDENMESAEKPEVQVDGGDKAATVKAGHFSPFVITAQAATDGKATDGRYGDFELKFEGGDFYVDEEYSLFGDSKYIHIEVNKYLKAETAKIEVSMANDSVSNKGLFIDSYTDEIQIVNVVFDNVKIEGGFSWGPLILEHCNTTLTLKEGTSSLKSTLNNPDLIYIKEHRINGNVDTNKITLSIEQEEGADSRKCVLNVSGNGNKGGRGIYTSNQGKNNREVIVNGGTVNFDAVITGVKFIVNGGLVDVNCANTPDVTETEIVVNAGTHVFSSEQEAGITCNYQGGSIKTNKTNSGGYYKYILDFDDGYADEELTGVYGNANDMSYTKDIGYNTNDTYVDAEGKLYLWLKNAPHYITLENDKKFIKKRKIGETQVNSFLVTANTNDDENEMILYKPVMNISVNTAEMTPGDIYLRDFTTLIDEDGKEYVSGNGADRDLFYNDLGNKFWDIEWTLKDEGGHNWAIGNDKNINAMVTITDKMLSEHTFTLTARLKRFCGDEDLVETFDIKRSIPVTGIDLVSVNGAISTPITTNELNLSVNRKYVFLTNSAGEPANNNYYKFSVSPNTADDKAITLSMSGDGSVKKSEDENGNYSYTFFDAGTYELKAVAGNGSVTRTLKINVQDTKFKIEINDWDYAGKSYKEYCDTGDMYIKAWNASGIISASSNNSPVQFCFGKLKEGNGAKVNESGDWEIDSSIVPKRDDISKIDLDAVTFSPGNYEKISNMTGSAYKPEAGVYLAKAKLADEEVEKYYVFVVNKISISQNDLGYTPNDREYSGKAALAFKETKPTMSGNALLGNLKAANLFYVLDGGKALSSIPNIQNARTYKLVVSVNSAVNCKGSVEYTIEIERKNIADESITVETKEQYYTGEAITLSGESLKVTDGSVKLKQGIDYEVTYSNNVNVGSAVITIEGIGNYKNNMTATFDIVEFNDSDLTLLYEGKKDKKGSYPGKVKITTEEGYLISDSKDGTYSSSYTIVGVGSVTKKLYFKNKDGILVPARDVTVNLVEDITVKYNGSETKQDWYTDNVKLTADGYLLSTSKTGTFEDSVTVEKTGNTVLYFKEKETGIVLEVSKTVSVNIDTKAPTGKIEAVKKSWNKLQGTNKTVAYTNEQKSITITGSDSDSKIKTLEYYISNEFISSEKTLENKVAPVTRIVTDDGTVRTVVHNSNWSIYNSKSKPGLSKDSLNYIYAKVTDNAGNSFYMSSEGIWYDTKAPKVTSAKATPKDTSTTVKVTATDTKGSGVKYVYVLVKKKDESKPTAKTVKSSGKRKELSKEDGKDDFEITGLTAKTGYVVYTVAEDFCENLSEVKETKITTKETSSSSSSGTGGKGGANGAAGAGGAGAGGSNSAKRGVSSDSAKNGKGGAGGSASENGEGGDSDKIRNKVPFIDDASEGVLTGREYTSGWDKIENETLAADAPAEIHIDMNGATVVPAKLLNDFANRDVTVYLEMGDGLVWAVNGLSFTSTPEKDIDFKVKKNTKNIPSKILTEVADVYPHTNLTLSHDGDFGFTAIMSLDMGADNSGMFGNLYYYNEDAGSLEFIDSKEIGGSGNVQFEFTHASDYTVIVRGDALTEKTAAALTVENSDSDMRDYSGSSRVSGAANVAKRSNHLWLLIISIISILLCGFILFMPDKKKWGK